MSVIDESIKISIGRLLQNADECSKRVLTAFDPSAKRSANIKAISSFNLDILEPCATFLGINLADSDGNKIFTKESLVSRILLGINSLLPSQCSECSESYVVEVNPDNPPRFTCFQCFQGSHDCDRITAVHEALSTVGLLAGHVWLCSECHASSNPVKPRRSKSRHNSTGREDPALSRIRHELGQQIHSPPGQSPQPLENVDNLRQDPSVALDTESQADESEPLANSSQTGQICSKYKTGKCPHGLRGNKVLNGTVCKFQHPKRCTRYSRFGTQKKVGCTKGDNCQYYHPKLCKFSVKEKCCTNKECTFVHLKGTKRKRTDNKGPNIPEIDTRTSETPKISKSGVPESDHFLELKMLMKSMQLNFQQEIAVIKASMKHPNYNIPWHYMSQPPVPLPPHQPQMVAHQHLPQPPVPGMTFIPHSLQ